MQASEHFSGSKPVLLIIMDGWGLGTGGPEDAIALAHTPNIDRLREHFPQTKLMTHGLYVGLPSGRDMGGSEVGHLTMGAGKILDQGPTRIRNAINDGSFFRSEALHRVIEPCEKGGTLHLLGLLSDGNIHSHIDHFHALIDHALAQGIRRLRVHALLDGRDVGVQSAQRYICQLEDVFTIINSNDGFDYGFASGGGREIITMDRDRHWPRVELGWRAHVHGQSANHFPDMMTAIRYFREETPGLVDQDMPAFVIVDEEDRPLGAIHDGDGVIMVNFRGDRAMEISEAFCLEKFDGFDRGIRPHVTFAGMMVYDEDRNLPELQILGSTRVENPFGKRISNLGIKQFRLAETQKYAHVTFFFNGGYREPLDAETEDYILIPSEQGVSFAERPGMRSVEVCDKAVALIKSGEYGFGLINFANADMVGHCGRIAPVIAAVEAVDTAVGRIVAALEAVGGCALITADHGNAEEMLVHTRQGDEPCTKHSLNPVPCILFQPQYDGSYHLRQPHDGDDIQVTPGLSHLAATLFMMLGLNPPEDMNPSLLEEN